MTTEDEAQQLRAFAFQNSAYAYVGVPMPLRLESAVGALCKALAERRLSARHPVFMHSANLVRRMGDVAMYVESVDNELRDPSPWRAAVLSGSLLVGYFSTAKSVLDAAANGMAAIIGLALPLRDQDLSKGRFRNALRAKARDVWCRIEAERSFIEEVVRWRDAAVHRTTPLVMVCSADLEGRHPRDIRREEVDIRMVADENATLLSLPDGVEPDWIDVMAKPREWQPHLEIVAESAIVAMTGRIK